MKHQAQRQERVYRVYMWKPSGPSVGATTLNSVHVNVNAEMIGQR